MYEVDADGESRCCVVSLNVSVPIASLDLFILHLSVLSYVVSVRQRHEKVQCRPLSLPYCLRLGYIYNYKLYI